MGEGTETTSTEVVSLPATGSVTPPALESSVPAVSGNTEDRINGLMSLYNKEQDAHRSTGAEVERLRALLTQEVTAKLELSQQLEDARNGQTGVSEEANAQITSLSTEVAGLKTQIAELTAKNTKLQFLVDNADLIPYAGVIPESADPAKIEAVVNAVRSARKQDTANLREHLTTPRSGGAVPRSTVSAAMTPAEIDKYLREAKTADELARRIQEVSPKK